MVRELGVMSEHCYGFLWKLLIEVPLDRRRIDVSNFRKFSGGLETIHKMSFLLDNLNPRKLISYIS